MGEGYHNSQAALEKRRGVGGGGSGTKNLQHKWPKSNFPSGNFMSSRYEIWVPGMVATPAQPPPAIQVDDKPRGSVRHGTPCQSWGR